MIRRNRDNKIRIPWFRRRIRTMQPEFEDIPIIAIQRDPHVPNTIQPQPVREAKPVRVPAIQPVIEPVQEPIREPFTDPTLQPSPFPEPPFPLPMPERNPQGAPFREPEIQSPLSPDFDWAPNWEAWRTQQEPSAQSEKNFITRMIEHITNPIIYFVIGREALNNWVEANITDPIYQEMLSDPVLGLVLREAEKAELDMQSLANYFANYDWDNMDIEQLTKDLTLLVGAAGAARLIAYFVGRRVIFRM